MKGFFVFLFLVSASFSVCIGQTCVKVDSCVCEMSDNTGMINLKSVGSTSPTAKFTVNAGYWSYNYNPCYGFSSPSFNNLAIQQFTTDETNSEEYNLGVQDSENFVYSLANGVSIKYEDDPNYPVRNSSVLLVCNSGATTHALEFIGELITTEYEFILTGPCACPGKCDENGIITTTTPQVVTTTTKQSSGNSGDKNDNSQSMNSAFNWNQVGADIISLIFHDLLLIVMVACIAVIVKCVVNIYSSRNQTVPASGGKGFENKTFSELNAPQKLDV